MSLCQWLYPLIFLFELAGATTPLPDVDYCPLSCYDPYTGVTNANSGCNCADGWSCTGTVVLYEPNATMRDHILGLHNEARDKVAVGIEWRGSNRGGVTDMIALAYDQNLEKVAGCWARKCLREHDHCRKTDKFPRVGQNVYGTRACTDDPYKEAVDNWYSEIDSMTMGCMNGYSACVACGHYAQLMWAKTTHVGCAYAVVPGRLCHVFCNYGPGGNIPGHPVHNPGPPGDDCPARDRSFRALCASKKSHIRASSAVAVPHLLAIISIFTLSKLIT